MKKALMFALFATLTGSLNNAMAAGTAAGTQITNVAYLDTYPTPDPNVPPTTTVSPPVTVTVIPVPGVVTTPDSPGTPTNPVVPTDPRVAAQCGQSVIGIPGQNAVLTYEVLNPGNKQDTYDLSTRVIDGTDATKTHYFLDNGDGVFTTADTLITNLTLQPDQKATVFATYPIDAAVAGNTGYSFSMVTTSRLDGSVFDANNYGCIVAQSIYGVNIVPSNTAESSSPGTVTYTHTLTNTGNSPIDSTNTTLTTNNDVGWPTTYQINNEPPKPSLQEALEAHGPIPAGQNVTVTVVVQTPPNLPGGTKDIVTITAVTNPPAAPGTLNTTTTPVIVTDTTTVKAGESKVSKTVASCGMTDTTCANPVPTSNNEVKPNEILQYTVLGQNAGQGGLRGAVVYDPMPDHLKAIAYTATIQGGNGGQLLYSTDRSTWTTTPPTITGQERITLYVAYDQNGNGQVSADDIFPAGAVITMTITAQVK